MIGDTEEAYSWLERGYRERDPLMISVATDPKFDPLHYASAGSCLRRQ